MRSQSVRSITNRQEISLREDKEDHLVFYQGVSCSFGRISEDNRSFRKFYPFLYWLSYLRIVKEGPGLIIRVLVCEFDTTFHLLSSIITGHRVLLFFEEWNGIYRVCIVMFARTRDLLFWSPIREDYVMYSKFLTQGDCIRINAGSWNQTSAPVQALDHKSNSLPRGYRAWLQFKFVWIWQKWNFNRSILETTLYSTHWQT